MAISASSSIPGGQAPESLAEAVYQTSRNVSAYRITDLPELDLSRVGSQRYGDLIVDVVDPVSDYQELMEGLFDFEAISTFLKSGERIVFDAMHGVTGPYAQKILCEALGAPEDSLLHATPLPDFGGLHPDPNPVDAGELLERACGDSAPALAAASDGDGDRNMILGPRMLVSPCDSVAVMLAHARLIPGYRDGVPGVARSMPTSRALDRVAAELEIPCYETPTGWRFFCNLLEAGHIGLCGEESFGTGSSHTREKDGLWAVLYWLNMLARLRQPVPEILLAHWQRFGRHYYQRCDYFIEDGAAGEDLIATLAGRVPALAGEISRGLCIREADEFHYRDPVDGSESHNQGIRVYLDGDARIVYRLSGTGTSGATLRVYLEKFVNDDARLDAKPSVELQPLLDMAADIARIGHFAGLKKPTAII